MQPRIKTRCMVRCRTTNLRFYSLLVSSPARGSVFATQREALLTIRTYNTHSLGDAHPRATTRAVGKSGTQSTTQLRELYAVELKVARVFRVAGAIACLV